MPKNSILIRILRGIIGVIFLLASFMCITKCLDSVMSLTVIFGFIAIIKFIPEILLFFNTRKITVTISLRYMLAFSI